MVKAQILIVEDDNIIVMELRDRLQNLGYAIVAVTPYGEEAIEKAADTRPDLVLMDIRLKGDMDGIEAAEQIRARFDIPVIYLTAYADEHTLQRAKLTDPFGYILKPCEERQLRTNIEMALYKHSMERKLKESERWLATTLRSIGDGVIATDAKGGVVLMNPVAEALTGWKQEDALGKDLTKVLRTADEEMRRASENLAEKVIQQGIVVDLTNDILIARDGREIPIDHTIAPIKDDKGNSIGGVLVFRDIIERKRAEEALKASQEYARNIIDSSLDMIIAVDMDRRIVEFNRAAQETFGYSREEVLGVHVDILYADPQEGLRVHQETIERGQCIREILDRRKNGEIFPCLLSASVLRDVHGELVGVMGVSRDITERKRVEKALEQRASQLTLLNDIGGKISAVLALEEVLNRTARLVQESFGYHHVALFTMDHEQDELLMRAKAGDFVGLFPPDHRIKLGQGMVGWVGRHGEMLLVNDVRAERRYTNFYPDAIPTRSELSVPIRVGEEVVGVLDVQSPLLDAFDESDMMVMETLANQIAVAIENARLHQKVQRRVEELTFLNRVGRAMTSSLDLQQVLTTVLEETALVLGTEAGSILLLDEESDELVFEATVGPCSGEIKGLRLPLGQGIAGWVAREGQRLLVPNVGEDPRFYPGIDETSGFVTKSILAVPLRVKGRVTGVIQAVNKTEGNFSQGDVALLSSIAQSAAIAIENARLYKDLQDRMEELKRTQAQLIQSAKLAAIGELAAGVAHELNNPLTSIMGFASLLLQKVDDDDPMKKDLQVIDREAARTKGIVGGLLDFARQREPRLELADLNEVVRSTMTLICPQAKVTGVTIKESCDETLHLISLDADQIKQVFLNMMTNAIQAMPEGGELKVVTAYRPQARDGTDCMAVEFHDTGVGIPVENLPRIFDPFFTTKETSQGTGLGLSISHGIVDRHGGWIEVESKVGKGSTFTVMLPVAGDRR